MTAIEFVAALLLALSWVLSMFAMFMLGQAKLAMAQMQQKQQMVTAFKSIVDNFFKKKELKNDRIVPNAEATGNSPAAGEKSKRKRKG